MRVKDEKRQQECERKLRVTCERRATRGVRAVARINSIGGGDDGTRLPSSGGERAERDATRRGATQRPKVVCKRERACDGPKDSGGRIDERVPTDRPTTTSDSCAGARRKRRIRWSTSARKFDAAVRFARGQRHQAECRLLLIKWRTKATINDSN